MKQQIVSFVAELTSEPGALLLGEMLLKGFLILLLGTFLIVLVLRRSAASTRHLVWAAGLAALLMLPFGSLIAPSLNVTVPAEWGLVEATTLQQSPPQSLAYTALKTRPGSVTYEPSSASNSRTPAVESEWAAALQMERSTPVLGLLSPSVWLLCIWFSGVLIVLFRLSVGFAAVRALASRARRVTDGSWLWAMDGARARLKIERPVRFLRSEYATMPMTWGVINPTVMLPADADDWDVTRLQIVLMHELAHIKRKDWLIQIVGEVVCALHWFNPLAWHAVRQLRTESEQACDELVLESGTRASDYAAQLLTIARLGATMRYAPRTAIAMARHSQLHERLTAILNPRRPVANRLVGRMASIVIVLLALPLAAMRPVSVPSEADLGRVTLSYLHADPVPEPAPRPAWDLTTDWAPQISVTQDNVFEWSGVLAAGQTVEVKGVNGAISARQASGNTVEISARKKGRNDDPESVEIEVIEHADGVTVCAVYPTRQGERPNVCRPASEDNLNATDNDVNVTFDVRVPSGVHFRGRTVNGAVGADLSSSRVDVQTVNGAVSVSAGDVVRAKTVNGAIKAAFRRDVWSGRSTLEAVNGGIIVELPPMVNSHVSARTVNGGIESDFGLGVRSGPGGSSLEGALGSGGGELSLQTVNGGIRIHRTSSARLTPDVSNPQAPPVSSRWEIVEDDTSREARARSDHERAARIQEMEERIERLAYEIEQNVGRRMEELTPEIEARAERIAEELELRMEELAPLMEERALHMVETITIPMLEELERELPILMERLEAEIPLMLEGVVESLNQIQIELDKQH